MNCRGVLRDRRVLRVEPGECLVFYRSGGWRVPCSVIPASMTVSILTVSRGPNDDTEALVRALERSSSLPDELIVVWCGTPKRVLSSPHFAIVDVEGGPVPDDDGDLSDARNLAAQAARGGCLIFVDPDCLPSRTMIE